ncbi:MAG: T9SS C-terminal target domain-containing protein [Chlorobi bacterium CHB2]|nr:T9SS C-terminal target domain-containing protein [Chlorobi bacterium CHB2]
MNAPVSIPTRQHAVAILTLLLVAGGLRAQAIDVPWQVIGTGGGTGLANNKHAVSFTLGQPIVGQLSGTGSGLANTFYLGFWLPLRQTSSVDAPASRDLAAANLRAAPNPFGASTTITYRLESAGRINAVIFDLLGRPVRRLMSSEMADAGSHTISWDGTDEQGEEVPAGHYLCQLQTDNSTGERTIGSVMIQHL